MIDALVFSRNRPIQLFALLESMEKYTNFGNSVSVLYSYDDKFMPGMNLVKNRFPYVNFRTEVNFRSQVWDFVRYGNECCTFLVDDMIFKDHVRLDPIKCLMESRLDVLAFSLRHGLHITYNYPMDCSQRQPMGKNMSGVFEWDWTSAEVDWAYPFSVDAHIFRRSDLESWINHLEFHNPNTFEGSLQLIRHEFVIPSIMACNEVSSVINIPHNRVQNTYPNRTQGESLDHMNDLFMMGYRIDTDSYFGMRNISTHTTVELSLR